MRFVSLLAPRLGAAALQRLKFLIQDSASWADKHWVWAKGPRPQFCWAAFRRSYAKLKKEVGLQHLGLEWLDERLLGAACAGGQEEEAKWLSWVSDEVHRLRRVFRRRWHVPSLTTSELIAEITIALLTRLRKARLGEAPWPQPQIGQARSLIVASLVRRRLQKKRALTLASAPVDVQTIAEKTRGEQQLPSPEAAYLEKEHDKQFAALREALAGRAGGLKFSKTQRRWLETLLTQAADAGPVNFSEAARLLRKTPSAGSRMRQVLAEKFSPWADRLGLLDQTSSTRE